MEKNVDAWLHRKRIARTVNTVAARWVREIQHGRAADDVRVIPKLRAG